MRKPHVFISSRLKLGKTRARIKQILEESGFSAEIYESDSTPANEPATYLKDIVQADFAIFVLDETYGTPRPLSRRSGVHEEWIRVNEQRIPNHVYLKRPKGVRADERQKKFIKSELIGPEISYYYYQSNTDLLRQVRQSIAKLALDIAGSPRYRQQLDALSVMADVVEHDHEALCNWERAIAQLLAFDDRLGPSRVTDGWGQITDIFAEVDPEDSVPFLDGKAQDLFFELLKTIRSLAQICSDQSDPNPAHFQRGGTLRLPVGSLDLSVCKVLRRLPDDSHKRRSALKMELRQKLRPLGDLIRRRYVIYRRS